MSWTVSIGTGSKPSARARRLTRSAIRTAGSGSSVSDRNALRIATSILRVFHATTWPERRCRRGSPPAAGASGAVCERRITSAFATSSAPCSISAASTSTERSGAVTRGDSPSRRSRATTASAVSRTSASAAATSISSPRAAAIVPSASATQRQASRRSYGWSSPAQDVLHLQLGQLIGRQHRGALHLQVIEDFVEVDDHDTSSFQSSSSATRARAEAFWYSVTRPSKKFCSLRMSISSASHGSGFSMRPTSGSSPTPSRRRSAM